MIDKTRFCGFCFSSGSFKININREDIMKKFLSVILALVLVLSAFGTVFADNSYGTYTKISGKIERDGGAVDVAAMRILRVVEHRLVSFVSGYRGRCRAL